MKKYYYWLGWDSVRSSRYQVSVWGTLYLIMYFLLGILMWFDLRTGSQYPTKIPIHIVFVLIGLAILFILEIKEFDNSTNR